MAGRTRTRCGEEIGDIGARTAVLIRSARVPIRSARVQRREEKRRIREGTGATRSRRDERDATSNREMTDPLHNMYPTPSDAKAIWSSAPPATYASPGCGLSV